MGNTDHATPELREVAYATRRLGLRSDQRTYELARRGLIPCVRLGRRILFDPAALDEFVRRGGRGLDEQQPGAA